MPELSAPKKSSPRILVVDDNHDNTYLMRELLQTRGYDVIIAHDSWQAERHMQADPPDLVLLDVIMPGKSGYELCREWKNDPATRLIPVISGMIICWNPASGVLSVFM